LDLVGDQCWHQNKPNQPKSNQTQPNPTQPNPINQNKLVSLTLDSSRKTRGFKLGVGRLDKKSLREAWEALTNKRKQMDSNNKP